jgi:hypothetical protein
MAQTIKLADLQQGDVVLQHGMRCLVDREIRRRTHGDGVLVISTNALVLNRDDVPSRDVPLSFTSTASYPSRGMAPEPAGTHRWTVQGADWVSVYIEDREAGA